MSWSVVPIKECARVVSGATPKSTVQGYWDGDVAWVTPKDLANLSTKFIEDTPRKITSAGLRSCSAEMLPPGSVLFSSRAPIGHVAINTIPMATNQGFKSMIPKACLDPSFLYWWLRTNREKLDGLGNGATFKEVSKAVVERIEIPLPPLEEQKRIATILDQADSLRRLRQRAIDRLNTLGQAIFYEMFGDPSVCHEGWLKSKVYDFCERVTVGVVVKPASYYQANGIPAIRGTNIKGTGIDLSDPVYFSSADNETKLAKTRIWEDDLVIVRSGRPGLAAVVPPELNGANSIDVLIATPIKSQIRPRFFRDLLNSPEGKKVVLSESRGQVQQHFNVGSLSEAEFFLPPIDLQIKYEQALDRLEGQRRVLEISENSIERLFGALQHRAFRGEL